MRSLKICLALLLVVTVAFFSMPKLHADETSEAILNLLIKKGLLTRAEVNQLKAEVAKKEPAAPRGLVDRVTKLEKDVAKTPRIGHALPGSTMKIGGYIITRFTDNEEKSGTDAISTANSKLAVSGKLDADLDYKIELGPHKSTSTSSSILYDVYMKAHYIPGVDITIGQFKAPYSQEYITSSSKIKTAERALFQGNISSEYMLGVKVEGDVFDDSLNYALALATGTDRSNAEDNSSKDVFARLVWSPFKDSVYENLQGLKLGAACQQGRQPENTTLNAEGDRKRNLLMLKYDYEGFSFLSEYAREKWGGTDGNNDLERKGWYSVAAYKFPVYYKDYQWQLEPHLKYEEYDPNKNVSRDAQAMTTAGLTWYLNKYAYLMLDYQRRTEQAETNNDKIVLQSLIKF